MSSTGRRELVPEKSAISRILEKNEDQHQFNHFSVIPIKKKKLTRILLSGEHSISNHASINYLLIISDQ